jgi:lantibiotic modifying enzyme
MSEPYLDVAHALGLRLAREAIWHEDRCNWMGMWHRLDDRGRPVPVLAALGPDLYHGTAGVALFLAELHAATGDQDLRRTALGAARQALRRLADGDPPARVGPSVYTGRLGVAAAAARAGARLGRAALLEQGAEVANQASGPLRNDGEGPDGDGDAHGGFDLLSGRAGGIVGLLILHRLVDDDRLVKRAAALADGLLASATRGDGWLAWSPHAGGGPPLTGLSHGVAGVGYALLELWAATGEAAYRHAAGLAFGYERQRFDPDKRNWPDLREQPGHRGKGRSIPFATLWCHGAPGIALTRLRAYQLDGDQTCLAEAGHGVATTRATIEAGLAAGTGNYSLCHGLAGNAGVLLHADEVLGDSRERELAVRVAEAGIERYAGPGRPWPCGVQQGVTPSLMLGLAGIGHFYLRLHDAAVPSVLLPRPDAFGKGSARRPG